MFFWQKGTLNKKKYIAGARFYILLLANFVDGVSA